ncbi:GntR family transcriptional regulator [Gordonia sp. (in: high G+C Gram-positive bacteria)]|uniref:GntR family transcriptional regulator n=1 Tax=Gordonia sp. (in: high G+C Gram-positive bacteria) TaxID=84139 RepID=UPI001DFCF476|nr:GntR family transcriptional regulator [Gordonia sp. (in: high G+C Gram-positive bacteria)]MCB1294767.1 GntR family transcriptional regulator [Gordonia sp. (in: high G+C Gram-positive bacteria)]HMS75402.1 GntR family transcriptional regulator [Gordonia sp. (in: high G+C Gram-positive bacteria)]HQV18813.1 GntR family transcriptional regulator [Gordonia sp. (in: high G+C Gram-positive bacteria)]
MAGEDRRLKTEAIAADLRGRILSGSYAPGDRLRLEQTAREFGVSITPVREALLKLQAEDLVELQPYRGFVVAPLSPEDIDDMFWVQANIYGRIVERCAKNVQPADIAALTEINNREPADITEWEMEFHLVLNTIAGARKLENLLGHANRYTPFGTYTSAPGWHHTARGDHEQLLAALAVNDPESARIAIAREYEHAREALAQVSAHDHLVQSSD